MRRLMNTSMKIAILSGYIAGLESGSEKIRQLISKRKNTEIGFLHFEDWKKNEIKIAEKTAELASEKFYHTCPHENTINVGDEDHEVEYCIRCG